MESLKGFADDVSEALFNVFVEQQLRNYENVFLKPKPMIRDLRLSVLDTNHIPLADKNRILKRIKLEDFKAFSQTYLNQVKVKAIMQGNLDVDRAKQIMSEAMELLKCDKIKNVS